MLRVFPSHLEELDDEHLKVVEDLVRECCSMGLLTQELIWNTVAVSKAETLHSLFPVSYHNAETIIQVRENRLHTQSTPFWKGSPPSSLLVQNLPSEWSQNTDPQNQKERSASPE
jgi:hypothetical protein